MAKEDIRAPNSSHIIAERSKQFQRILGYCGKPISDYREPLDDVENARLICFNCIPGVNCEFRILKL